MSIYDVIDNAQVDFSCKVKQINAFMEMVKNQYPNNTDVQNVIGLLDVLLDDFVATVSMGYETIMDRESRRIA